MGRTLKNKKNNILMKDLISVFSLSFVIGFLLCLSISLQTILEHQYFQYKMFRLALYKVQELLNKWVVCSVILSFFLNFLPYLFLAVAKTNLEVVFFKNNILPNLRKK